MHTESRVLPGSRKTCFAQFCGIAQTALPIIEIQFRKLPKKLKNSPKNPLSATHKWVFGHRDFHLRTPAND